MWLFIGTFALAFLAALMLVWLDDRIAETDSPCAARKRHAGLRAA